MNLSGPPIDKQIARAKLIFVAVLLAACPMPVIWPFCFGFLPPAMQVALSLKMISSGGIIFFAITAIHAAIFCAVSYFLSWLYVRKMLVFSGRFFWPIFVLSCVAILSLGLAPIYSYDCMDGHGPAYCNAVTIYAELFSHENQCGDIW